MNPATASEQSASAEYRVRAMDLGMVAASALYARYVFQALTGMVAPGGGIFLQIAMTPAETIGSCEIAVGVATSVVASMLLAFGPLPWQPPASLRHTSDHVTRAVRSGDRLVHDSAILLVVVAVVCAALAVLCLPYRSTAFDSLGVFVAAASPGFLAALLMWTRHNGGFGHRPSHRDV